MEPGALGREGYLPLNRRETTSSENEKSNSKIENVLLSRKALCFRKILKILPDCFNFISTEYKKCEEREVKKNNGQMLENMLTKNKGLDCHLHTLDGYHTVTVVLISFCPISFLSTQHH